MNAPYVGIVKGQWRLKASSIQYSEGWASLEDLVQARGSRSETESQYKSDIEGTIDRQGFLLILYDSLFWSRKFMAESLAQSEGLDIPSK